jgi:hypothetical protein
MEITVTVTPSSHPDFDLYAYAMVNGRQIGTRGTAEEVDVWYDRIVRAAQDRGCRVTLVNEY